LRKDTKQSLTIYERINRRRWIIALTIIAAMACAAIIDIGVGSSKMEASSVLEVLWDGPDGDTPNTMIIWAIRLPMMLTCLFVGLCLGVSGLQVQTITNNPLASPYTLGITASASFGAAISITFGLSIGGYVWIGTAILALLFSLGASLGIFFLGNMRGMSANTLVFAGIIMNFFFSALQQYLQYMASAEVAQVISSWTFGNLSRSNWTSVTVVGILAVIGVLLLAQWSWKLTALTMGEERAISLGVDVERLRLQVFVVSAVLIAGAVGFIGTVAFVGLVAPHCAKLLLGEDQRFLLPVSGILGSLLMLTSSIISKLLSHGSMLPVGIITSIVGVPFLFVLLMKSRR